MRFGAFPLTIFAKWRILIFSKYKDGTAMEEQKTQEQITATIVAQAATATAKAVSEAAAAAALLVAKENSGNNNKMAVLETKMENMEKQQGDFESEINRKLESLDPKFDKIYAKLEEITAGRPTWSILCIITFLSCTCVGLITFVASHAW